MPMYTVACNVWFLSLDYSRLDTLSIYSYLLRSVLKPASTNGISNVQWMVIGYIIRVIPSVDKEGVGSTPFNCQLWYNSPIDIEWYTPTSTTWNENRTCSSHHFFIYNNQSIINPCRSIGIHLSNQAQKGKMGNNSKQWFIYIRAHAGQYIL